MEIFGHLERLAASLYPLRVPIAIGAAALFAGALFAAYRLGLHLLIERHRLVSVAIAGTALVVIAPVTYYLASPLWISTSLIEPAPGARPLVLGERPQVEGAASAQAPASARGEPSDPFPLNVTLSGEFAGADAFHFGRGRALIAEVAPRQYALRMEDFAVRNGPDLYVYLSSNPAGYAPDAINLGRLKASEGAFNYEIPAGTDISRVKSVVVWCRQFAVLFATAPVASR